MLSVAISEHCGKHHHQHMHNFPFPPLNSLAIQPVVQVERKPPCRPPLQISRITVSIFPWNSLGKDQLWGQLASMSSHRYLWLLRFLLTFMCSCTIVYCSNILYHAAQTLIPGFLWTEFGRLYYENKGTLYFLTQLCFWDYTAICRWTLSDWQQICSMDVSL